MCVQDKPHAVYFCPQRKQNSKPYLFLYARASFEETLNNLSSECGDRLVKQDVCSYELRMEISLQETFDLEIS